MRNGTFAFDPSGSKSATEIAYSPQPSKTSRWHNCFALRRRNGIASRASPPRPRRGSCVRCYRHRLQRKRTKSLQLAQLDQVAYWFDATSETARAERFAIALGEGITCYFPQTKSNRHYPSVRLWIESARRPGCLTPTQRDDHAAPQAWRSGIDCLFWSVRAGSAQPRKAPYRTKTRSQRQRVDSCGRQGSQDWYVLPSLARRALDRYLVERGLPVTPLQ